MAWWNEDWLYRKQCNIANPNADYQMKVTINRISGNDVDCESHCQSNFGDVRFIASDDTTELSYWMESQTGTSAVFWVKTDGNALLYLYYGHVGFTTTTQSGTNTFIFFDDFNAALGASWTNSGCSTSYNYLEEESSQAPTTVDHEGGITVLGDHFYISYMASGVTIPTIRKLLRSNVSTVATSNDLSDNIGGTDRESIGGIDTYNNLIYYTLSQHIASPTVKASLYTIATDLTDGSKVEILDSTSITDGGNEKNHFSWVAVCSDIDRIYIGNWGTNQIYVFDLAGNYRTFFNSATYGETQDASYDLETGYLYLGQCDAAYKHILKISPDAPNYDTFTLVDTMHLENARMTEGFAYFDKAKDASNYDNKFYLMPLASPTTIYKYGSTYFSKCTLPVNNKYIYTAANYGINTAMRYRIKGGRKFNTGYDQTALGDSSPHVRYRDEGNGTNYYHENYHAANDKDAFAWQPSVSVWYLIDLIRNSTTNTLCYADNVLKNTNAAQVPDENLSLSFSTWGSATGAIYLDWVFVRKYNSTEPSFSSFGSEQEPQQDFTRTLSDTVIVSDSLVREVEYFREYSESDLKISDTIVKEFSTGFSELIKLSDALVLLIELALSDSITLSDSLTTLISFDRKFSDTVKISELFEREVEYFREYSDEIHISDLISKEPNKILSESAIKITDSLSKVIGYNRLIYETILITDSLISVLVSPWEYALQLTFGGESIALHKPYFSGAAGQLDFDYNNYSFKSGNYTSYIDSINSDFFSITGFEYNDALNKLTTLSDAADDCTEIIIHFLGTVWDDTYIIESITYEPIGQYEGNDVFEYNITFKKVNK
jgi:hypothetical protein